MHNLQDMETTFLMERTTNYREKEAMPPRVGKANEEGRCCELDHAQSKLKVEDSRVPCGRTSGI